MKAVVNDPTVDPKLQDFYSSCMNLSAIESNGINDVDGILQMIKDLNGVSIVLKFILDRTLNE